MPAWLAFGVVVCGWVITHALTLRAQRRQFLNNVLDAARKDVVKALRREQLWAGGVSRALRNLTFLDISEQNGMKIDWLAESARLHQLAYDNRDSLLMVLEEYENVFPEIATCRWEVCSHSLRFAEQASALARGLMLPDTRRQAFNQATELANGIGLDISAFMDDFRVHVQNRALGEMTGHVVSRRRVRDEGVPRVLPDADGNLRIQR